MTREEVKAILDAARPPCHECGAPVQRAELLSRRDPEAGWRPWRFVLVCPSKHRVTIEADA